VDRIQTLIERTATPRTTTENCGGVPGTNVPNNTYGWGRVDALAAVGVSDADADGIPNWWEIIFSLSPTNAADGARDDDEDGLSNFHEYLANTDPTNAASVLRITDISVTSSGQVTVVWSSRQDGFADARTYDVYRAADLPGTNDPWTCMASNLAAAGVTTAFQDDVGSESATHWFYRVGIAGTSNTVYALGTPDVWRLVSGNGFRYVAELQSGGLFRGTVVVMGP